MSSAISPWFLVASGLAGAQEQQLEIRPAALPPQVAPAASAPIPDGVHIAGKTLPGPATPIPHQFLGGGDPQPAELDDSVPLPVPARVTTTPAGDTIVEPASGDPYFLGFAGGKRYPPVDEHIDPLLAQAASQAIAAGRTDTFAFVMFQRRITRARIAELEALGVRLLGFHPHYCLKVALPVLSIDAVAAHPDVRWIGVAEAQQKVHPVLASMLTSAPPGQALDVWIDVFESDLGPAATSTSVGTLSLAEGPAVVDVDPAIAALPQVVQSHGWQQLALEALGVEILEYQDGLRAFRARITPELLEAVVMQDFVQFVETDLPPSLAHDESTPMIGNDILRWQYNGGVTQSVTVGEIDSGVDFTHQALGIWGVGWDFTGTGGPFQDGCEHGTHVAGTILGDGTVNASFRGNAPGLSRWGPASRMFIARHFNDTCGASSASLATMMSVMQNDFWDGSSLSPRPVAVNNSWGTYGIGWIWWGTEANARAVDEEVFARDQVYVWAAGNEGGYGPGTIRLEGSAKNALTVGCVTDNATGGDPGVLSWFSSRGPVGDGRWKPNVCAPGENINSCDANSFNGYQNMQGTSMAAPHVTGLIADLCDAAPWLKYHAAALGAAVMASATTKGDYALTFPSDTHLDEYGTGRVEDVRTVLGTQDSWWNTWYFDLPGGVWNYADFTVPVGTQRIVVVMNYYENAASAGASQALVNNLDLYIDQDPIDPNGNTGDWVAQQSTKDNCEIRIINNPSAGAWRWKVWPSNTFSWLTTRVGMTVYYIMGDTTPAVSFQLVTGSTLLKPNQNMWIDATVICPSFVASAAFLDSTSSGDNLFSSTMGLHDGSLANLIGNAHGGRDGLLGDIPKNYGRAIEWYTSWPTEGIKSWNVQARGDNFATQSDTLYFTVDGTPPPLSSISSTTHTPYQWSTSESINFQWATPVDNLSGTAGYSISPGTFFPADPGTFQNLGLVNSYGTTIASSATGTFTSIKPVDNCGNWNTSYAYAGPFYIDAIAPQGPFNLQSSSHTVGVQTCNPDIQVTWGQATDYESLIAGYASIWNSSPSTVPNSGILDLPWNSTGTSFSASIGTWYLHVRTKDYAGNWGTAQHIGPFLIGPTPPIVYCTPKTNSLGCLPLIGGGGTPSASMTSGFFINCDTVRNNKSGLLFYGINGGQAAPFQGGTLCIAPPIRRTPSVSSGGTPPPANDCSGAFQIDFNAFGHGLLGGSPIPQLQVPGTTVSSQWWGRDPGFPAPNNTMLSNALRFTLCP